MKFPPWWGYGYFLELHIEITYNLISLMRKKLIFSHFKRLKLKLISELSLACFSNFYNIIVILLLV